MKNTAFNIATLAILLVFASCKKENNETFVSDADMAMSIPEVAPEEIIEETTEFLYITAPSGLSLRAYGNLQSEKLARMPYGTRVKVVAAEKNATMSVGGIKGGMDEIEFNHKKGFAFNGYLSKYFPPERNISAKGYASELAELFPEVVYTATVGGTVVAPSNTESIELPDAKWHEAFYMAQRLFDFPKEFTFPHPKGKNTDTIFDGKPKKGVWISQLEVTRADNELEKIEYVYGSEKYDSKVTIEKVGDVMKISKTELVK